jgi:hypothetical protein
MGQISCRTAGKYRAAFIQSSHRRAIWQAVIGGLSMLATLAPYVPALDVVITAGVGVIIAAAVTLYGRRHEQWSRRRRTER